MRTFPNIIANRFYSCILSFKTANAIFLQDQGRVISWGQTLQGLIGNDAGPVSPVEIDFSEALKGENIRETLKSTRKIACGPSHSVLLLNGNYHCQHHSIFRSTLVIFICLDGRVIVWGKNFDSQIGIPDQKIVQHPVVLPIKDIVDVSTGFAHTLFLQQV